MAPAGGSKKKLNGNDGGGRGKWDPPPPVADSNAQRGSGDRDWSRYSDCSACLGGLISIVIRRPRDVLDQGATTQRPEEDLHHGEIERNADRNPAGAGGQLGANNGGGAFRRVEPSPAKYRYVGGGGAPPGQPNSYEQSAENENKHDLPMRKGLAAQVLEFFKHTARDEGWHSESESEEEEVWPQAWKNTGKGLNSHERAYIQALPFLPTASLERSKSMCPLGGDNSKCWREANGLPSMERSKDCRKWRSKPGMRVHARQCGEEVMLHRVLEKYYELIDRTPIDIGGGPPGAGFHPGPDPESGPSKCVLKRSAS